jgi:hypothetical protein
MKYGMADIDWKYIAAQLAHTGDKEQSEFLNSFNAELRKACITEFAVMFQMASIDKLLTQSTRDLLSVCAIDQKGGEG